MSEKEFLEGLFENYITSDDSKYLRYMRKVIMDRCLKWMKPGGVAMELGCEIGYMTSLIAPHVKTLDVIEGSEGFIREAKKRNIENAVFYNKLFEEVEAENQYDYVFASHVVEHLIDPQETLEVMYKALKPGGYIFVTVPNALAASRQLAVKMNLFDSLYDMTPNDIRGGHRRV